MNLSHLITSGLSTLSAINAFPVSSEGNNQKSVVNISPLIKNNANSLFTTTALPQISVSPEIIIKAIEDFKSTIAINNTQSKDVEEITEGGVLNNLFNTTNINSTNVLKYDNEVVRIKRRTQEELDEISKLNKMNFEKITLERNTNATKLMNEERNEEALQVINDAILCDLKSMTLLKTKSKILQKLGRNQEAVETIDTVIKYGTANEKNDPEILNDKITILEKQNKHQETTQMVSVSESIVQTTKLVTNHTDLEHQETLSDNQNVNNFLLLGIGGGFTSITLLTALVYRIYNKCKGKFNNIDVFQHNDLALATPQCSEDLEQGCASVKLIGEEV